MRFPRVLSTIPVVDEFHAARGLTRHTAAGLVNSSAGIEGEGGEKEGKGKKEEEEEEEEEEKKIT